MTTAREYRAALNRAVAEAVGYYVTAPCRAAGETAYILTFDPPYRSGALLERCGAYASEAEAWAAAPDFAEDLGACAHIDACIAHFNWTYAEWTERWLGGMRHFCRIYAPGAGRIQEDGPELVTCSAQIKSRALSEAFAAAVRRAQQIAHAQQPDDPPDDIDPATGRPYGW